MRLVRSWNGLPKEAIDVPGLPVFKRYPDNALSNILSFLVSTEEVRELDFMIFEGLFQLFYSILFCSALFQSTLLYFILFHYPVMLLLQSQNAFFRFYCQRLPKLKLKNRCEVKEIMEGLDFE